jgi:hypothetical protein
MYWCAIFLAVAFVWCFFFLEETNFQRLLPEIETESSPTTSPTGSPSLTPADSLSSAKDPEKSAAVPQASPVEVQADSAAYTKKTYLQKLALWDKPKPQNRVLQMMYRPLLFLTFPVVAYSGFSYGSNLVWFNVLNATAGLILSSPPYNFSASMVGASYTAALIGVGFGAMISGWFGDKLALRLARRNGGVREPEHRLWVFGLSVVLVPGSLLLWGLGAVHQVHWFGLLFAMGCIACTNTFGLQLSISYCIDSYKDLSHEAIVSVILVRNTMSFAVNYGITPWLDGMGMQNAMILAAVVGLLQVLTVFPMIKWGKALRKRSRERYYRYVAEGQAIGMVSH